MKPPALLLLSLLLLCAPARAEVRPFSAGSLIIPMDSCYQPAIDTIVPAACQNGGLAPGDGIPKAYGLVYLLLKRGITVFVVTDPDKAGMAAVDLTLTQAGGQGPPAGLYDRAARRVRDFTTASQVSYRGSPFVIDVGEAASVQELLASDPLVSTFTSVAIHSAYVSFQAPVSLRMNGVPPRVAVFVPPAGKGGSAGSEGVPLMQAYLLRAGLSYSGAVGTAAAPGEIYDVLGNSDVLAGRLVPATYQVLWLPHFDGNSTDRPILDAFAAYADQGGVIIGQCASIRTLEDYQPTRFLSTSSSLWNQTTAVSCYPGNPAGWNRSGYNRTNWNNSACFDPRTPVAPYPGAALEYPLPAHPLAQVGDFQHYVVPGTILDYRPAGLRPGAQVLIRARDSNAGRSGALLMSTIYKDNDPSKGQIIYFGGHFYGDVKAPITAGMRIILNTLLFTRPTLNKTLLTRASATQLRVDGKALLFQGAYEEANTDRTVYSRAADRATFVFPQTPGHLLAFDTALLATGFQRLGGATGLVFDTAKLIAPELARVLYTSRGTGGQAALVPFTAAGLAPLGQNPFALPTGFQAADVDALVKAVRAAPLGGIDHSTVAVVGPQPLVPGGATRPTVAYAGALDGMLHAVAVSGGGVVPGAELWALLPRELLPAVRDNSAGLDGSPSVGDTYDLVNGARVFRTLLVVPQGRYGSNVYGLDVSQPLTPALLWARGAAESGVELGNALGAAQVIIRTPENPAQSLVVLATSRPGQSAGLLVSGLAGEDGRRLWQFSAAYQRRLPGTTAPVPNDPPPPALLGPSAGGGGYERVYAADLDGRVWELSSTTGESVNGARPLADVGLTPGGNTQPIGAPPVLAIDRASGRLQLLVVTGGADWAARDDSYALYAFDLTPAGRQAAGDARVARLLYRAALPPGQRGYAPPLVSGNDAYVLASSGPLSGRIGASAGDAATLLRVNLAAGAVTATAALSKGAGGFALSLDGTGVVGSTARDLWQLRPAGADTRGVAVGAGRAGSLLRRLWLESR